MDLFKSLAGGNDKPAAEGHHGGAGEKHSTTELLTSAKVVADAAKSAASGATDKVDKGKAAGAASDLLDAASDYGKLSDKGYGSYVDKAQGYLHQYETKGAAPKPSDHHADEKKTEGHDGKSESGGAGDYLKMAQGFLGKN